jgi:Schlafen, AlbA_2
MSKTVAGWNEDDLLALPSGENDAFERKGSKLLDLTQPGVREDDVLNELAKQLSAFANTGGGLIIYGLTDKGAVDNGGIARTIKGRQSTKEWLEDVMPTLAEFEIVGFNVYEILPKGAGSKIDATKSLYIADVPNSDRAPHQSKRDHKYYVRLGGKSHPASHRLIEDIRNRQKHPVVELSRITLEVNSLPPFVAGDPPKFAGSIDVRFHVRLKNIGPLLAQRVCLRLVPLTGGRFGNYDNRTIHPRGVEAFWELDDPIYPGMEIEFWMDTVMPAEVPPPAITAPWGGPWFVGGKTLAEARFSWLLFADNAPMKDGSFTLEELGFRDVAGRAIDKHPQGGDIRKVYECI